MARKARRTKPTLTIESSGHLFVGGRIDRSLEGSPMVGQMYVEYWIPRKLSSPYPVVMIHGNWQTGTNFTGTPDGREGWAQYFLRRGHAVYVVDQVARGRSAHWAQSHGPLGAPDIERLQSRFVGPKRYKRWPQAKLHTQWPGTAKPGDPYFDAFYASQFPSLSNNETSQEINRDAVVALLDEIGPAVVLTHSQSGAYGWLIADARPKLVKALISIEPNGPPVYETELKGPPEWFGDTGPRKTYGLGFVPLAYQPPLKRGQELRFVQQDEPDAPGLVRAWLQEEPARTLPNLAKVPVLVVVAEASYHAAYDHCTVAYLRQAGVPVTFIRLEEAGIHGNGHMMMLEKNSDEIAEVLRVWLKKALSKRGSSKRAPSRRTASKRTASKRTSAKRTAAKRTARSGARSRRAG